MNIIIAIIILLIYTLIMIKIESYIPSSLSAMVDVTNYSSKTNFILYYNKRQF